MYNTSYNPTGEFVKSITPLVESIINPLLAVNVPPTGAVMVGEGSSVLIQKTVVPYPKPMVDSVIHTSWVVVSAQLVLETMYVTVYLPSVDSDTSISPVVASISKPVVELNVPPLVPEMVGVGSLSAVPVSYTHLTLPTKRIV